ncbi:MAG: sarcosine oxidase subunit gamma family protein [Tistlia sp.]|uniref:sarcosine oxidase subunit gamma n=1 Tax=Tistlia sp. TaxID=3057121 RepID=UPI0034A10CC3
MADTSLAGPRPAERLSALSGHDAPGRFGAPGEPAVTLSERRGLALALLSGFPESRAAAAAAVQSVLGLALPEAGHSTAGEGGEVLWQGPERWLLVAPEGADPGAGLVARLEAAVAEEPTLAVTDLGHARTVIRLEGPGARALLAKEAPLDLAPEAFPPGAVAMTRFGHLAVTLHCRGPESLEILAFRSFGLALFEELRDRAEELGYAVAPPARG